MNTFLQSSLQFNPLSYQFSYPLKFVGITVLLMSVTGCSVVDSFRSPQPQARNLPKIPEIKRQRVPRYTQPKKVTRTQKAPVKRVSKPQNSIITNQEKNEAKNRGKRTASAAS